MSTVTSTVCIRSAKTSWKMFEPPISAWQMICYERKVCNHCFWGVWKYLLHACVRSDRASSTIYCPLRHQSLPQWSESIGSFFNMNHQPSWPNLCMANSVRDNWRVRKLPRIIVTSLLKIDGRVDVRWLSAIAEKVWAEKDDGCVEELIRAEWRMRRRGRGDSSRVYG